MSDSPRFSSEGALFKYKLGATWQELSPDIQRRFEANPTPERPLAYEGTMTRMDCSRIGMLMAQLSRFSGALQPYRGSGVPVDILVYGKEGVPDIFKQRAYFFPGWKKPFMFTSRMRLSKKGEILEYVGYGLGMKLLVLVENGNLHFRSDGYFLELFGYRIPLPMLLAPGETRLVHQNIDADSFRIRIEITHPLWGKLFLHEGTFRGKHGASA